MNAELEIAKALRLIGEAEREVMRGGWGGPAAGEPVDRLPVPDEADAERKAELGARLSGMAAQIDLAALPHDLATTVKVSTDLAERWSNSHRWWWLVHDPLGVGFYGLFGPTAYCGGFTLNGFFNTLGRQPLRRRADLDRYLALVGDITAFVGAMRDRLQGQAERQIVMPAVQLAQARVLVRGLAASAPARLRPDPARLSEVDQADPFLRELDARLSGELAPAFEQLSGLLEGDYGERAGERVGLSQYPGGREIYEALIPHYLTQRLTAEQVHEAGHRRMADIRGQMAALRADAGFTGSDQAYLQALAGEPRWRAETSEGVAEVFRRYIARFRPHVERLFHASPKAPYDVKPLPEALTGAMTFGFYEAPPSPGETGHYVFNGVNLTRNALNNVAALNYHELVPGHHFHLSSQRENELLAPLRKHAFFNAYNEGWAEYAATLAGEAGCYEEPEERFGRLMMDAFLTCRLVVDTGMNAFDWSLEQARAYMRDNSFMPETEIQSESVRYSCDIPGQSLAYKLGDTFLMEARERMRAALGDRFDIRDFHEAVLGPGALPLPLVAENVARATAERLAAA
jgi:uncharacterized protein (DUF885 family)